MSIRLKLVTVPATFIWNARQWWKHLPKLTKECVGATLVGIIWALIIFAIFFYRR